MGVAVPVLDRVQPLGLPTRGVTKLPSTQPFTRLPRRLHLDVASKEPNARNVSKELFSSAHWPTWRFPPCLGGLRGPAELYMNPPLPTPPLVMPQTQSFQQTP